MRKFISILFALVLVLSFSLVTAVPVGAQEAPTVTLDIPENVYRPAEFVASSTTTNSGTTYSNVRFNITVSGPESFATYDRADVFTITKVNGSTNTQGINDTFVHDGGNFVGYWGPVDGFPLPASYSVTSTFTIQMTNVTTAPVGDYEVTVELDDLNNGVLATATDSFSLSADTLYVGTTEYQYQFTTIQAAIDSATGTTILVADGTYTEDLTVDTANLTLKSVNGRDFTTIQGDGSGWVITVQSGATNFTLGGTDGHGFKVIGGANSTVLLGTVTGPSGVTLSYNTFDTSGNPSMAIAVGSGGAADLTISHNTLDLYGGATGVYFDCHPITNLLIDSNIVNGHGCPKWINWVPDAGADGAMISNNIVYDANVAMRTQNRTNALNNVTYTGNTITGGYIAIGPNAGSDDIITNLSITGNSFIGPAFEQVFFEILGSVTAACIDFTTLTVNNNNFDAAAGEYAIKNGISTTLNAECNYWGSASGPTHSSNPGGTGALITANVDYEPWLLEVGGSCYEQTQVLQHGWTLVSTDNWIDTTATSWEGVDLLALKYTAGIGYEDAFPVDLEPVNALYLKTVGGGGIAITYSGGVPVASSKDLEPGWNLISSATHDNAKAVLSPLRYIDVGEEQGVGLATLVSQGNYNRNSESFYLATLGSFDWITLGYKTLNPFDGYWVYMNAGKIFGVIPQ